jgi:hypothetical protein
MGEQYAQYVQYDEGEGPELYNTCCLCTRELALNQGVHSVCSVCAKADKHHWLPIPTECLGLDPVLPLWPWRYANGELVDNVKMGNKLK